MRLKFFPSPRFFARRDKLAGRRKGAGIYATSNVSRGRYRDARCRHERCIRDGRFLGSGERNQRPIVPDCAENARTPTSIPGAARAGDTPPIRVSSDTHEPGDAIRIARKTRARLSEMSTGRGARQWPIRLTQPWQDTPAPGCPTFNVPTGR